MKLNFVCDYRQGRLLAHAVKKNIPAAISEMARQMALLIPTGAVLIPTPSRTGRATNTLQMCLEISDLTGARVADILRGKTRMSMYEAKRQWGRLLSEQELGFRLEGALPPGVPVIIDNVLATGTTIKAIINLIPDAHVVVHSVDTKLQKHGLRKRITANS